jgi:hypothetical protein
LPCCGATARAAVALPRLPRPTIAPALPPRAVVRILAGWKFTLLDLSWSTARSYRGRGGGRGWRLAAQGGERLWRREGSILLREAPWLVD